MAKQQTSNVETEVSEELPMRYIAKVHIENFQDHDDTTIEFTAGINLITGSSNAGKSAILRAINFCLHNQPSGVEFISFDEDEARVTLEFSDGTIVQRIKSESRNCYILEEPGNVPITFDKVGKTVPPAVHEAMGCPPSDEQHGPVSYADQMLPLFLVTLGPTHLPRAMSELTGISDMEDAAQTLGQRYRTNNRKANESTQRLARYDTQLEEYKGLDELLVSLGEIEAMQIDAAELAQSINNVNDVMTRHADIITRGTKIHELIKKSHSIAVLSNDLEPIRAIQATIKKGKRLTDNYGPLLESIKLNEVKLKRSRKIIAGDLPDMMQKASEMCTKIKDLQVLVQSHLDLMAKGRKVKSEAERYRQLKEDLEKERDTTIEEMRSQGLWCMVCNRPMAKAKQ